MKESGIWIVKNTVILTFVYFMQFIVMPILFPQYYPQSNEAFFIFYFILIMGIVAGMLFNTKEIKHWLFADIIYCILIIIYSGKGAYGIGMRGITLAGSQAHYDHFYAIISSGMIFVMLLIFHIIVKGIILLSRKILLKGFQ